MWYLWPAAERCIFLPHIFGQGEPPGERGDETEGKPSAFWGARVITPSFPLSHEDPQIG